MRRVNSLISGLMRYQVGSKQFQRACKIADRIAVIPDDKPLTNAEVEALIVYLYGEEELESNE